MAPLVELCATSTVLLYSRCDPLVVSFALKPEAKKYVVPSMTRCPGFSFRLNDPYVHLATTSTVTFDVLFAVFWLF